MTTTAARPARSRAARSGDRAVRVAIVGATGYVGSELIRLLSRHPNVEIVGLVGRGRDKERVEATHPHLATTGLVVDAETPDADAVFLALPHGTAAATAPGLAVRRGHREREGLRAGRPSPRGRDRAGAGGARPLRRREPGRLRRRLPATPHPDDTRDPRHVPRPAGRAGHPGGPRRPLRDGV